ncbi:hypothetical protein ACET3Z_005228 [Daucus carota]
MPLVRVEVRNEYTLGMREVYKDEDDPKALLEGVVVAGLVGVLRQLGDLAEFAADVFHGLQEQVTNTSSRSNQLKIRARKIEAAVSPLEKSILSQRSHLHFAYTTGSHWHAHIQSERNHFIYSDLPIFVMDLYEKCRRPPHLHLLDKFDTGGPGSCLKKFSDPAFFRRESAGFDGAYAENFSRHKKARKRKKKKRTWVPDDDEPQSVNHGTPTSSHSGRLHYASQNFHPPSQTVSTYDAAKQFEIETHLIPSYSRNAEPEEYVFNPSNTSKFDGCEPEEISSRWMMNHSDNFDTFSLDEQTRVVANDVQEQTGAASSCITWDEKIEIVEPTGPQYHFNENVYGHPTNSDPILLEGDASNFETECCSNKSPPKSVCAAHQFDEYESDIDIYMDSRNTMESESETDLECQTKREVEQYSDMNTIAIDENLNRINPEYMESNSANAPTHVPPRISTDGDISDNHHHSFVLESSSVLRKEISTAKPISVTPVCNAQVQSRDTGKSSILDSLSSSELIDSDDMTSSKTETAVRNLSSFDSNELVIQALNSDKVLSNAYGSQDSPSLPSVTGTNFWTNGGLLGLQPSKPPDFSTPGPMNHDTMGPSRGKTFEGNKLAPETDISEGFKVPKQKSSSKHCISLYNDQEDSTSVMKTSLSSSQTHSESKNQHTAICQHNDSQFQNLLFSEASIMIPGTKKPDNLNFEAAKSLGYIDKNSSRIFELSNEVLDNSQGKVCFSVEDNPLNSFTSGISERNSVHQTFQTFSDRIFTEQFGTKFSFISPSSSPPLEHMKISFQPIDGFEVSKLKLDFPGGNESLEGGRDVFPSFQLVPEVSLSLLDINSDSDDTFCDSNSHGSDDSITHYSVSYFEEWGTIEYPKCDDSDMSDALCINSIESVSSNLDFGRIAPGVITSNSGLPNLFYEKVMEHSETDLPSFDTLDDSINEELQNDSKAKIELDSGPLKDSTLSPTLPPTECGMNENPDMATENQVPSVKALKHEFDQKLQFSTISHQQKVEPFNHGNMETIGCTKNKKHPDGQKLNLQKDSNQSPNSKVTDENEDFLQQIRSKSLSLRRTIIERPNLGPGVPTNVSVTAILEKANAIRQAVGSDDGEDNDSWSE